MKANQRVALDWFFGKMAITFTTGAICITAGCDFDPQTTTVDPLCHRLSITFPWLLCVVRK